MTPTDPAPRPTPRDARIQLNKMERWCERNADRLGAAAVRLRALFEVAHTPEHADYLAGEIRELAGALTHQPHA
ncbi:hypothetical protein [Rubrivirga sp.]|uniref:hypothetical protein n=1 Tax=Rubrivirga sp. TaxID=1885344 RepID=UPI003B52CD77